MSVGLLRLYCAGSKWSSSFSGMGAKFEPSHPAIADIGSILATFPLLTTHSNLHTFFSLQLRYVWKNRWIVKATTMLVQSGLEATRSKILPSSFMGMGAKFKPSHWQQQHCLLICKIQVRPKSYQSYLQLHPCC